MITQQSQIKVNLPLPLKKHLEKKANKYGLPIAGYIKHLVIKDIEAQENYPVFQASERTEIKAVKALQDYDKAIEVTDIDTFFKNPQIVR